MVFVRQNGSLSGLKSFAVLVNSFERGFQVPGIEAFGNETPNLIVFCPMRMFKRSQFELIVLIFSMHQIILPDIEVIKHQCPEELFDGTFVFGIKHIALALCLS